jgi:hypothetical protein
MLALRAAALVASLLLGGCAASAGTQIQRGNRCEAASASAGEAPPTFWYLLCIQSP